MIATPTCLASGMRWNLRQASLRQWWRGCYGTVNHRSIGEYLPSHLPSRLQAVQGLLYLRGRLVEALPQQPPAPNALGAVRRGGVLGQIAGNLPREEVQFAFVSCHVGPESPKGSLSQLQHAACHVETIA